MALVVGALPTTASDDEEEEADFWRKEANISLLLRLTVFETVVVS